MAISYGKSIVDWSCSLSPPVPIAISSSNHHCCQIIQSDVWTLLTSLTLKSESATASRSTISSARKPKNCSSSESLKRCVSKTSNAFLLLDFQKLSHFRFVHKDNAKWHCYCSRDSREIVQKFPCMERAKFTNRDRMFWDVLPWPGTDVFGCCAQQRVKKENLAWVMSVKGLALSCIQAFTD